MPVGLHQGEAEEGPIVVGRRELLEELQDVLREVHQGRDRIVVLTGPSGAGKTAVLETFVQHCRSAVGGVNVLSATGDEWEAQLPLAGYSQLMQIAPPRSIKGPIGVERAVGVEGPTSVERAAGVEGPTGDSTASPVERAEPSPSRTVNYAATLLAHLDALQSRGSVVVAVDDVHHLDEASQRILAFAMRRVHAKRVLFVLTLDHARSHRVVGGLLDLLKGHRAQRLRTEPLGPEDVRELARRRFRTDVPVAAAQGLVQHTGGLPQQIEELLGELPAETWQSRFPSLPASSRVSSRVRGVLDTGSPELVAVAEAVSVLERAAGPAEVAHVSGVECVMDTLDEGHHAGLLGLTVDQTHSLVRFFETGAAEAVADLTRPSRRLALHRRAARVVRGEGAKLNHRVAATAGADEALAVELEDFARRRAETGVWHEAATALFSASRLSSDHRSRDTRLLRAVDALVGAGDVADAQMWASAVEAVPSSPRRASVLGYLHAASGDERSAQSQLQLAWDTLEPTQDPAEAARVAQRFVLHGLASWDGPFITRWAETAMSLAAPASPARIESEAIYGLGLYAQGRLSDAESAYERAFRRTGENAQKQRIQMGAGWLALRTDRVESARVRFEAAVPTEHRGGSLRISLWAEAWLARAQLVLGDWDAVAATVSRASVRLESSRIPLVAPMLYWTAAELWSMRGDWDRARQYVSLAAVNPGAYRAMQVPAHLAWARFHEARADYESSLEALEPLTTIDPWTDERISFWTWQDTFVNALVMTNRLEQAEQFLSGFERVRRERHVPSDQARIAWSRGRLVAAQGDPDTAREHFESALDCLRGLHRPYLRARISFAFGQSMRRAGKRRLASSVLQTARDLYDTLGAATYVERCDRELKATGVETGTGEAPSEPAPANPGRAESVLTVQEQAVAGLVAGGATNKETARSLFLAEKTVQYHLTRIYRKLGIRSRSELAARYRETD